MPTTGTETAKKRQAAAVLNDAQAHKLGFDRFEGSSVARDGQSVTFTMRSGAKYEMPVQYLVEAFGHDPDGHGFGSGTSREPARVARSRRLKDSRAVRVVLDNGDGYTVPWDTVLMACEPQFQYFGGLTLKSRSMTEKWLGRVGSFRRD
jgi:hypothetical protein